MRDRAAAAAVAHVADGMIVGLGSGDTASRAIRLLGGRKIVGVATSEKSAALARSLGIEVRAPDDVDAIDLTIDGADELDAALRLVKGGGGAHTREKLVARASRQMIVVADAAKRVARLGEKMRLPVEVLPLRAALDAGAPGGALLGLPPVVRAGFTTDNGNVIADCALGPVGDLAGAGRGAEGDARRRRARPAFLDEATLAYVGTADGVRSVSTR